MPASVAQQLEALWESTDAPPDAFDFLRQHAQSSSLEILSAVLVDQKHRWKSSEPILVEDYLRQLPALAEDPDLKLELAVGEFRARHASGKQLSIPEFAERFHDIRDQLRSQLSKLASGANEHPQSQKTISYTQDPDCGERLGRYRIERILGQGAFGKVYLAYDQELQRQVAIKVPTPERFRGPEDAEQYLNEARTVASLNHPNIVPVYDVGRTEDGLIYVVSKFIEGCTLDERLERDRPSHDEIAQMLAVIAEALHHAHQRRLIHRDIKPSNLLLEGPEATPYVADFGLAIREEDYLRDGRVAGTPAYMSPEQARGEGHRLDGRSDVFSLGVVFYELLTGTRPFRGSTPMELAVQLANSDPPPPRSVDDTIPTELERVCLRALAKRITDRYGTAAELAEDLRNWDTEKASAPRELTIVPRGLRSFEREDADFFLDLLPGPRNRHGLPMSIDFWKTRIEETDPDHTFLVGLIYGPSGCGKSSLVKAGLLPQLSATIRAVYIEATPDETEMRLLRGLRKSVVDLPGDLGLVETFSFLRRMEGQKVLVVIDQFEQWLHAYRSDHDAELVDALRQCDGRQIQAIVMVRDDFAMAATRFMHELDTRIIEGQNFATVDLFDLDHARRVLVKFGQAFGKLPSRTGNLSEEEQSFVNAVATGLAQDGKVVSVRLSLFAEMIKGKTWEPATLEQVGGTDGVGVNFLDEKFSGREANPEHRLHQQAARDVLAALLPQVDSDIKGHMRSHDELLEACGYQERLDDFKDLLRILDGELRLITPTDPEGVKTDSGDQSGTKYYQLTHDYLVPALREWLTRKRLETRRGRAELKLQERTSLWHCKQENRNLPTFLEWASIRMLTEKQKWTLPQQKMMAKASRMIGLYSGVSGMALAQVVCVVLFIAARIESNHNANYAKALVESLSAANTAEVEDLVDKITEYQLWATPLLETIVADENSDFKTKLHSRLALVKNDPSHVDFLFRQLLVANAADVHTFVSFLEPHKDHLKKQLWKIIQTGTDSQRVRAAAALARYDSKDRKWAQRCEDVVASLISVPTSESAEWIEMLRPVSVILVDPLAQRFQERNEAGRTKRSFIASALSVYLEDDPKALTSLILMADNELEFRPLLEALRSLGQSVKGELKTILNSSIEEDEWKVRFYHWEPNGPMMPPANWDDVLESPVVYEWRTSQLSLDPDQGGLPSENVKPNFFAAVASKQLTLPGGTYSFEIRYDDGIRIWLDEAIIYEQWSWNHNEPKSFTIDRQPGLYNLKVEYFQIDGGYKLDLYSGPVGSDVALDQLKKQANAAACLLELDETHLVWPLFQQAPDPSLRSVIIDRFSQLGVSPVIFAERIKEESDPASRYALILTLGHFNEQYLSSEQRQSFIDQLLTLYRDDPDPGVHSAAGWTLRKWSRADLCKKIDAEVLATGRGQRHWFINSQEQTFAVINGLVEFFWGGTQEKVTLSHSFAVASHEVTVEQFQKYRSDYQYNARLAPQADCPIIMVSWYEAAAYCNWLSEQEDIPKDQWCYEPNDKGLYAQGMKVAPDFLSRTGYRLPTEEEWECMCRAGSYSTFGFGEPQELLRRYAWYASNSEDHSRSVGMLLPNGNGAFDMHGNVMEWCHELVSKVANRPNEVMAEADKGVFRGGSFNSMGHSTNAALRFPYRFASGFGAGGFRLARTYPLPP